MKSTLINSDYIGALIDGWESLPNDLRADLAEVAPSFVKAIADIYAETHDDCDDGYACDDLSQDNNVLRVAGDSAVALDRWAGMTTDGEQYKP